MGVAYIIQGTCGYNFCECATKYMSYNPKRTFLNYSATFWWKCDVYSKFGEFLGMLRQ